MGCFSRLLQIRVLVCFTLLAGGRVINLFIPIIYREIGNVCGLSVISQIFHCIRELVFMTCPKNLLERDTPSSLDDEMDSIHLDDE